MNRRPAKQTRAPSAEVSFEIRTIVEGDITPERLAFAQVTMETVAAKALLECPQLTAVGLRVVSHQIREATPDDAPRSQPLRKI